MTITSATLSGVNGMREFLVDTPIKRSVEEPLQKLPGIGLAWAIPCRHGEKARFLVTVRHGYSWIDVESEVERVIEEHELTDELTDTPVVEKR